MFLHGLGETINSTSGVEDLAVTVTQHFHKYIEATYSYFFICDSVGFVHRRTKSNCLIDNKQSSTSLKSHLMEQIADKFVMMNIFIKLPQYINFLLTASKKYF